jgi:hypothetical protein
MEIQANQSTTRLDVSPRDTPRLKVDFNELFAEVAHRHRLGLHLSGRSPRFEMRSSPHQSGLLDGNLEETIYLSPLAGRNIPADKVLLLLKSLYGLKQSSQSVLEQSPLLTRIPVTTTATEEMSFSFSPFMWTTNSSPTTTRKPWMTSNSN